MHRCASRQTSGALLFPEWIDDSYSSIILLVVQVLGINRLATDSGCGSEYRGVPIGYSETVAEFRSSLEDLLGHRLHRYSSESFDEAEGLLVGQPVGSGPSGGLVVELG